MLLFALPMIAGNMLQQLYNVVDTLIVGKYLGTNALAAVGSSYALMTFLTSIILGLCMGSGVMFSICYGKKDEQHLKSCIVMSFFMIALFTLLLNELVFWQIDGIMRMLQIPAQVYGMMREYLWIIFCGMAATFLYNYFAFLLRAIGNSVIPLVFLGVSAVLNVALDLLFVLSMKWGVGGAALATVISQYVSGIGLACYTIRRFPEFRICAGDLRWNPDTLKEIFQLSSLTCVQQSVMNLGILMVQGRVNSFGPAVMAAFTAAVKIDSFAYMPAQDFGNAFSTFVAQNYGAGERDRIREGIRCAAGTTLLFCAVISAGVCAFARPLMLIFVKPEETEIIRIGMQYLRIEGAFYCGIGCLFLLYGLYRALQRPEMSVILTVISLGTRVVLAYALSAISAIGVIGIWVSIPIGWVLADAVGLIYYRKKREVLLKKES